VDSNWSKTMEAVTGITREEWLRRYKHVTEGLDWDNMSANKAQSVIDECEKLNELNPDYRIITGSVTANAWLTRPEPKTPGEAAHDLIKIQERARVEIERRKQSRLASKVEELWRRAFRRKDRLIDAIREAARRLDQLGEPYTQADIAKMTDRVLEERKIKSRKVCPKGWVAKSLTEAYGEESLKDRVKTFITRALRED